MNPILFIHFIAIGVWAGCIATEIVCELDQKNVKPEDSYIASLHWKIDKYVELPAILLTLLTGFTLLQQGPIAWTLLLKIKITAGLTAVLLNIIAAYTIYQRYRYFSLNDEQQYQKYHSLHDTIGIGCVISLSIAIVAGGMSFSH